MRERTRLALWSLLLVAIPVGHIVALSYGPPLFVDLLVGAGWVLVAVSALRSAGDYRRFQAELRAAAADWRVRNPAPR